MTETVDTGTDKNVSDCNDVHHIFFSLQSLFHLIGN